MPEDMTLRMFRCDACGAENETSGETCDTCGAAAPDDDGPTKFRLSLVFAGGGCPACGATGPAGPWRAALEGYPGLSLSAEAVAAGLLPAVAQGWSWPDALRHAVALGASADLLGEVDLDAYELLSPEVVLAPAGGSSPG